MITSDVNVEPNEEVFVSVVNDTPSEPTSVQGEEGNNKDLQDTSKNDNEVNEGGNDTPLSKGNGSKEEKNIQSLVDKKDNKNFTRTQQEKLGHSFAKLKQKHKAEVETLKKEIEDLKKSLEKKVVKDDFKDDDEGYLDAKLNERLAKNELAKKEKELEESDSNLGIQYYKSRAIELYPTQYEQQAYTNAYNKGLQEGTIDLVMGDATIREFLYESDLGPKLVEHFCMKPDVAERLANMSTARKSVELMGLESRLDKYLKGLASKGSNQGQQQVPTQTPKETLKVKAPVVGKVANKGANKTSEDRFNSEEELWEFMSK